ncbi:MAG: ketopantoate reductase family protein, partial [Acidimicrobiia bacterium]|nr:ketopantoate reductase family protein [Acidimicrobiia bacterium]
MRYVIFGAGGIGGVIGGRLAQHGHDVVLVARGAHHDAIRERGLRMRTPDGPVQVDVPVTDDVATLSPGDGDVVLLCTKSQDSTAALDAIATASSPEVAVVCAQNGVENERMALRRFERVHGMAVMLPATHLEPGVVDAWGAPASGILDVGRYPDGVDEVDEQLSAALRASNFISSAEPQVMLTKYGKLLMNLANVLEAACGMRDGTVGEVYQRARAEALACYEAAGIDAPTADDERRKDMKMTPIDGVRRGGGSTWQSLARSAPSIETDFLNGEICLLGRIHGVPTPVNAALQRVGR